MAASRFLVSGLGHDNEILCVDYSYNGCIGVNFELPGSENLIQSMGPNFQLVCPI